MTSATKTLTDVLALIAQYPEHIEVKMGWESSEETGERYLYVSLHERAPEGGWPSQGAMYRSSKGAIHWKLEPHSASRYADASRVSVTAEFGDPATCADLAYRMLERYRGCYDEHPLTEDAAPTIEERMAGGVR